MRLKSDASRSIIPFVLFLAIGAATASAQVASPRTITFNLPPAPDAASLKGHKLEWVKTGNDFDQSKFAKAEAIDKEIEKRIRAYDRETAIITFDVPINSERLSYVGEQKYIEFNKQIGKLNKAQPKGPLDKAAHFWRYGDIDVAVPGDTYEDQLNVYSIARAVEILKYRYPSAYNKLFVETRDFAPTPPVYGNPKYKNKYSVLLFSFDTSPDPIAVGISAVGNAVLANGVEEYSNVSVVSLHSSNIRGAGDVGSGPIYMAPTPDENYVRYLREGLIETLVHEMLHRYIDYRHPYDTLFFNLYQARYADPSRESLRIRGEEAIVTSTSLHYFNREGGLQSKVPFFYLTELNLSINTLWTASLLDYFAALSNPHLRLGSYKDRLRLNILD